MENLYGVSKRQWKKWNDSEQGLFNELYGYMYENQRLFIHPAANAVTLSHWKTTSWNAAWMAADILRAERKNG